MLANGSVVFVLTLKGNEELATRSHRLDLKLRNLLFLIQRGASTFEAILQNAIFPREEVVEKLRALVKDQFIALSGGAGAAAPPAAPGISEKAASKPALAEPAAPHTLSGPQTLAGPQTVARTTTPFPMLEAGASVSQARFVLCDFCLDQFGAKAQTVIDAVNSAGNLAALQQVLDSIVTEVRKNHRDQIPALIARIREINENIV